MLRLRFHPSCVRVVGVLVTAAVAAVALAAQDRRPDAADPAAVLQEAEACLGRKDVARAVALLRGLLRASPASREAERAREALAENGYGLEFQVEFRDARDLHRLTLREEDIARRFSKRLDELRVFFRQVWGAAADRKRLDLRIVVYDSRARFRERFPDAVRRSAVTPLLGPGDRAWRASIALYHDSRYPSREDNLTLIDKTLVRDAALAFLEVAPSRPLPRTIAVGLSEHLAVRLAGDALVARADETLEDLHKGLAREGLTRVGKSEGFRRFLLSGELDADTPPRVQWQWTGLSYALIDVLLNAGASGSEGTAVQRIEKLHAFLREHAVLEAEAADEKGERAGTGVTERLLERHFGYDIEGLHRAFVEHVGRYPPREPDVLGTSD